MAKMRFHFGLKVTFDKRLGQLLEQIMLTDHVFRFL